MLLGEGKAHKANQNKYGKIIESSRNMNCSRVVLCSLDMFR